MAVSFASVLTLFLSSLFHSFFVSLSVCFSCLSFYIVMYFILASVRLSFCFALYFLGFFVDSFLQSLFLIQHYMYGYFLFLTFLFLSVCLSFLIYLLVHQWLLTILSFVNLLNVQIVNFFIVYAFELFKCSFYFLFYFCKM